MRLRLETLRDDPDNATYSPLRAVQWESGHPHAAGWLSVMLDDPEVEVVGVHKPGRKLFRCAMPTEPTTGKPV